ncbi:MAG: hypothetical protein KAI66_23530, partial [Lentisphaeria bacterium]|nr:hypothetical protein [Lentisphaeria bacterium]
VEPGEEIWDFGDGSPSVSVQSVPNGSTPAQKHSPVGYAATQHAYEKPGHYIATATRTAPNGLTATTRLSILVES